VPIQSRDKSHRRETVPLRGDYTSAKASNRIQSASQWKAGLGKSSPPSFRESGVNQIPMSQIARLHQIEKISQAVYAVIPDLLIPCRACAGVGNFISREGSEKPRDVCQRCSGTGKDALRPIGLTDIMITLLSWSTKCEANLVVEMDGTFLYRNPSNGAMSFVRAWNLRKDDLTKQPDCILEFLAARV
jgi:hypothetical protein